MAATAEPAASPAATSRETAPAGPDGGSPGWAWAAAWPIASVFMLANVAAPLYVLWQAEFGFDKGTISAIFTWYMVGMGISLLVSGVISDRLGRKAVLIPALVLGLISATIFATASGVFALAVARVLAGAANGAAVSAGAAAVTDLAGPARKKLAALLGSVGVAVGTGVGPLWGGLLSETLSGPTVTVFLIQIALLLVAVLVVARMPLVRPAPVRTAGIGSWIRIPRVPRQNRRQLLTAVAVAAPGLTTTSFVLSLAPSLLAELIGTDNRIVAGAVGAVAFGASIGAQFALRRLQVSALLAVSAGGTVAFAGTLVASVYSASAVLLLVAAVFAGLAQGLGLLGGLSMLNQAVPTSNLAEANAALNISIYAVGGALSLALGNLSDAIAFGDAVDAFAVTLVVLAAIGAARIRWAKR